MKPDLTTTSFSAQNGYFFSNMSELAYKTPEEVESTLEGMEDCKGLQNNFQWFQVLFMWSHIHPPRSSGTPRRTYCMFACDNPEPPGVVALVNPLPSFDWRRPRLNTLSCTRAASEKNATPPTRADQEKGSPSWRKPEMSSKTLRASWRPTTTSSCSCSAARRSAWTG